jgi:hypothetical protein
MSEEYVSTAEAAKKVRVVLRAAFPKVKMSITSRSDIHIEWCDDTGVSLDDVKTVLAAAPFVEAKKYLNDKTYLKADDHSIWFDCYNIAKREADRLDQERCAQEYKEQEQRERAAIAQAQEARHAMITPIPALPQQKSDPSIFAAFDRLRERAEFSVNLDEENDRRPSWAPPLILGEELAKACLELGYLTMDDKWIGRLWAHFASPERKKRYFRQEVSKHPLHGVSCRGFQLFAGSTRQSVREILFEAQRSESGEWSFGPRYRPVGYNSPHAYQWQSLIRERERLHHEVERYQLSEERRAQVEARLAKIASDIEVIDAQDLAEAKKRREQQQLKQRVHELARARVLDFVGAPDAQMEQAGRLWGHCCRCGKVLIDPLSLERGIGPDCYQHRIDLIKRLFIGEGWSRERLSGVLGVSIEFIDAMLTDGAQQLAASRGRAEDATQPLGS